MAAKFKQIMSLFLAIQKMHIKTAFISKPDAFLNFFMMFINNLCFAFMWWILFQDRQTINGWNFDDMLIVFAITCNGFAIYALFFKGTSEMIPAIENGSIDSYLTLPRSPLFMISTSYSTFANWGDFATGYLAFFVSSYANFENFLLLNLMSIYAFMILYGFRLLTSSLAFFASNIDRLSYNLFMTIMIFMHQPPSIFVGWYKVMFLTIIPAGFLSYLPTQIIRDFSWMDLLYLNIGCFTFFFGSIWLFYHGLKRYSSGNRFGIR